MKPAQKDFVHGEFYGSHSREMIRNDSKVLKYRQIAQMGEALTGGAMQYSDSSFNEYYYNTCFSNVTSFTWDIIHWAKMEKSFSTYDENLNCIKYEVMKFDGLDWLPYWQHIITYNSDNNLTSLTFQQYKSSTSSWDDNYRDIYEFDSRGYLILSLEQSNHSNVWKNGYRNVYINNDSGKVLTSVLQSYDTPSSKWINSGKTENEYNINNLLLSKSDFVWNTNTLTWDKSVKEINTYDGNGNLLTHTQYMGNTGDWVEYNKYSFSYNGSDVASKLILYWNDVLSQWDIDSKFEYTYNLNDSLLSLNYFLWNPDSLAWEDNYKVVSVYNGNGDMELKTFSQWISGTWVDQDRTIYVLDAHRNRIRETYDLWDVPTSNWITQTNNYYYWEQYEGNQEINDPEKQYAVVVYPNPVSTYLTVESPFKVQEMKLYNGIGQIALSLVPSENRFNLDVSTLDNGLYFLQLETAKGKDIRKIQINR